MDKNEGEEKLAEWIRIWKITEYYGMIFFVEMAYQYYHEILKKTVTLAKD